MKKPSPPTGYRMLEEGKDITSIHDFIWIINKKSSNTESSHLSQRWAHSIMETEEGIKMAADTNKKYVEPKTFEDYCFFRCRKI